MALLDALLIGTSRASESRSRLARIYTEQALAQDAYVLWAFTSIAVLMTLASALLLVASPIHRMTGAAGLTLFGASTLFFTGQLMIRRRAQQAQQEEGRGAR